VLFFWIKLEWTLDTLLYEAFQDESAELCFDWYKFKFSCFPKRSKITLHSSCRRK